MHQLESCHNNNRDCSLSIATEPYGRSLLYGPPPFAGDTCRETCCQQTCGISSQWHERVCGPVVVSKHLGCTDHSRFPLLRPLLRYAADRRKMQGQPAGVSHQPAVLHHGHPRVWYPPPRRSSACCPCSPFLQSYQRGRQRCLARHQGPHRVVIGRCLLRRSPAPTPRTRRWQRCKVADTSLAVDRLGSSPGGGGGAAAEALWAGTSSARGGPAGCLEAALAVQPRRRGRARRRADAVRPVVGRRLRFRCSRGTAGGSAVSGGRAGPFLGGSEAAQRQGS